MQRFGLALIFCFAFCKISFAIVPALEREVNLTFTNEKITTVLAKIQEQTGLVFSYQPSIVNGLGPVSMQFRQKTVREVLATLLPKNIVFKSKSNYIILKEKPPEKNTKKTELSGYVYDKNTDKKLPNVTIYDKNTLQSVTTNEYGFYTMSVPNEEQCLSVNKQNYRDTCVSLTYLKDKKLTNISINPVSDSVKARDSINWRIKLKDLGEYANGMFRDFKGYINTINVKDTFTRNAQVSFLPFVGSNHLMSGNVYNRYSLNIFGGYSRGNRLLEVGGFFNINKETVTGLQMAGFFNLVGDSVKGAQLAGFFNATGKDVSGFQAAGFFNMNLGTVNGVQAAGFLNTNVKKVSGVQIAGMVNMNMRGIDGVAAAGLLNINRLSVNGMQIAGMMNIIGDTLNGASMAGLINIAKYSKNSLQVAGMMNIAGKGDNNVQASALINSTSKGTTRLQVSGFINRAHKLTGIQLGIINYADSASGVPFGLLSFVKKGLHQLELSSDEVFYTNVSLRTGVNAFYNIFNLCVRPNKDQPLWSIGYGVGSSVKISGKVRADFSATVNHVSSGAFYFATSEHYKFYTGVEYKFGKAFAVAMGPTFNLYWSDVLLPDYSTIYSSIAPYTLFNKSLANDFNLKGWLGGRIAVRFF